jgi:hypothetical protein
VAGIERSAKMIEQALLFAGVGYQQGDISPLISVKA